MKTSLIIKHKKLPNFIKSHKIFSKFKEIEKVFPKIGLDNCSMSATKIEYLSTMSKQLRAFLIKAFVPNYENYYFYNRERARRIGNALRLCEPEEFVSNNKIVVPKSLQRELTDFNQAYIECKYAPDIRRYYSNSKYNRLIGSLRLSASAKVVFSADGVEGAWDMATMSMRGISSCQSWTGCYRRNLVGSIIDPCAGIIYLTNGTKSKSGKGSRMIHRAVVRYVIHKDTRKPALMLERVYPNAADANIEIIALFSAFLIKKTKGKLPIVISGRKHVIPNSEIVNTLPKCGSFDDAKYYCKSYRDSGIGYAKTNSLFLNKLA